MVSAVVVAPPLRAGAAGAAPGPAPAVTRLSGADPAGTAAAVSAATFSPGVSVAYVATSTTFADALAGGAAIGGRGPILFADHDGLVRRTIQFLAHLHPFNIGLVDAMPFRAGGATP